MIEKLIERFLRYISIETTSSFESKTFPSTTGQLVLARTLKEDMESMGLSEVTIDDFGYVMGTLPSNLERKLPVIGFISHMDTSPEMSGKDVRPSIVKYQGGKLLLNKKDNLYIDPQLYPEIEDMLEKI